MQLFDFRLPFSKPFIKRYSRGLREFTKKMFAFFTNIYIHRRKANKKEGFCAIVLRHPIVGDFTFTNPIVLPIVFGVFPNMCVFKHTFQVVFTLRFS